MRRYENSSLDKDFILSSEVVASMKTLSKRIFEYRKIDSNIEEMLKDLNLTIRECNSLLDVIEPISYECIDVGDRAIRVFRLSDNTCSIHYAVMSAKRTDGCLTSKARNWFVLDLNESESKHLTDSYYVVKK